MDVLICNLVQRTEFILTTVPFQTEIRRKGQFEWTDIFVLNADMEMAQIVNQLTSFT